MIRTKSLKWLLPTIAAVLVVLPTLAAPPVADVTLGMTQVEWRLLDEFAGMTLRVSGPVGFVEEEFGEGENPLFDLRDLESVADGLYTWEIVAAPRLDEAVRRAMAESRAEGDGAAEGRLRASGALPNAADMVQSGSFRVVGGAIFQPTSEPEASPNLRRVTSEATGGDMRRVTAEDQVIPDDLIVQNSLCVGFDCVNNENFGFDTIRLKENNTRIKFEDTSAGSFPSNDWQLTANESASGGQNKFTIDDITGARVPFTIEAGSTTNSIYVDSTGRVGFRTSTPVLDIHVSTTNTPAIRLEQTNAGGFTAQTWDIAGNEANFFVRDVTGGSRLPFRIRPGAPTSSIDINNLGDVGFGTASPEASIDVVRSGGAATIQPTSFSDNASDAPQFILRRARGTTAAPSAVANAENLGVISFRGHNGVGFSGSRGLITAQTTQSWSSTAQGTRLIFSTTANGTTSPTVRFEIAENGDIIANGSIVHSSSRHAKENFAAADPQSILARVAELPIGYWNYKKDDASLRHLGPTAEDFASAFGLGSNEKVIAINDSVGVALAAVQGLHQQLVAKDAELEELKTRLAALEAKLQQQ